MAVEFGPLPEPSFSLDGGTLPCYTADQMRAYALAEVLKERERCATIAERGDDGDWSKSTGDYDARRGSDIARVIRQQPAAE